ncbi:MAG: iron-containing alcohol dehydrogenase [Sphaerochaetaceae bacterium]
MDNFDKAYGLLRAWKGENYIFGVGVLDQIGKVAAGYGASALVVSNQTYMKSVLDRVLDSLKQAGVQLAGNCVANDAKPNAPREDMYRLETYILHYHPDCIIAVGGGSTIDACKAANVLASLGKENTPEIDAYFGTGLVTAAMDRTGIDLLPLIAVETSASSGAHLTKYANITDPVIGQKKLIVDSAVIPRKSLFDYGITTSMPYRVTIDGALDAIAHTFEVFCGAKTETYDKAAELATCAIDLVVSNAGLLADNPKDLHAREAIGLATDLGGYAIMVGGTSGAHLTSFSLVDIVSHGTACGLMNPYYAVFYQKAIQKQLRIVGEIFRKHGFISSDLTQLSGRPLAITVAQGMMAFSVSIKAPTKLTDIIGFTDQHIERALEAAKDPQLSMKLKNMPVPLDSDNVDMYMRPLLIAARNGDMSLIREII